MGERVWDKFLTERDRQVFAAAGFGSHAGFGQKPAVLVVDVNYNFCGDRSEPILESIKRWHHSCGEDAWVAMPTIRKVIDAARAKSVPVIYTTGSGREDGWDKGSWGWKNSRTHTDAKTLVVRQTNRPGTDIVDEIAPGPRDIVIRKHKPSAFFGTALMAFLNDLGADSIIMMGTTTSGCVRASVLDAFSLNLRTTVVEEGCFDRSQASHAINLCDMHAKYADVVPADDAVSFINSLNVTYNLPTGTPAGR